MIDCQLELQANKMSHNNMIQLAIQYRNINHYHFVNFLSQPTVPYVSTEPPACLNDKEIEILRGVYIGKKTCITKNSNYNTGTWENQFQSLNLKNNEFNIDSRKL
jgi:hypothetical protein